MKNRLSIILLLILSIFVLGACSASDKKEQQAAKDAVRTAYKEKANKTNETYKNISFYLPFGFEVKETSPNNIILKNGSKTYILFYNQQEGKNSDVVYKSTIATNNQYAINETFRQNGEFGYFLIQNLKEDEHEMIVGIGGVKLTSEVTTAQLASESKTMMEIVKSVKLTKQK